MIPIIRILRIPKNIAPSKDKDREQEIIEERLKNFKSNPYLKEINFHFDETDDSNVQYNKITTILGKQADKIRRKHVSQLFYSTSLAQNGFLDAVFILSASVNHVKDIFLLYNGRVSNRDLFSIFKNVYYSIAIGGSEGIEYATDEIVSKFASDAIKGIPFIDKILSSLADGLVNAILLTRISYITENYCRLTYIEKSSDLTPSFGFVVSSAQNITSDIIEKIYKSLRKIALDKSLNFAQVAINPIGYVLGKAIENNDKLNLDEKSRKKEHAKIIGNPIAYGIGKFIKAIKKK